MTTYSVGTLKYNKLQLCLLFGYLLMGGFTYCMLAYTLIPTLLPLTLDSFGASGAIIGLVVGSIPAGMNMVMNPILGTNSDRCRTRWGRRIPFLAFATPFVTVFMILIGWMPQFMDFIKDNAWIKPENANIIGIIMICVVCVFFQFFNLIVGSIYYYLMPDVVPGTALGKYMALMKLAFALAGFLFNFYLMRYAKDYSHWIYTGIGLLFLLGFCILCLMVKEGQYPEPEVLTKSNDPMLVRALSWLKGYFKDSFGILFFTMLFLGTALHQVSTACRSIFNLLFATKDLGLTEGQFGQIMGIGSLISLAVIFICGMLMNKLKAIRIYIGSGYLIIALNIFGYFFVKDYITFYIVGVLIVIIYSIQNLCNVPMFADLFPKNKFGQFSSANAMINSLLMIVANFGGGLAIDYFGYRFIFIWDTIFTSLATIILLYVYFKWRRNNYSTDRIIQKAVSDSAKIHSVELIDAID